MDRRNGVTVSLGVANYPADGDSSAKLNESCRFGALPGERCGAESGGASLSEGGFEPLNLLPRRRPQLKTNLTHRFG